MVGGRLKGSPCLQRADEGHTIVNALGRTSYTPQPQGPPEGFRNPAQSAPESPCPGRGSHGRGGARVAPGAGEEFAKERLYKDGRGARADRAGDRTPPAAGEISALAVSRV